MIALRGLRAKAAARSGREPGRTHQATDAALTVMEALEAQLVGETGPAVSAAAARKSATEKCAEVGILYVAPGGSALQPIVIAAPRHR